MGAWKGQNITVSKAVSMAKESDKMGQHLNTILGKFGDKAFEDAATQGIDLAMYLKAVQYERLCADL